MPKLQNQLQKTRIKFNKNISNSNLIMKMSIMLKVKIKITSNKGPDSTRSAQCQRSANRAKPKKPKTTKKTENVPQLPSHSHCTRAPLTPTPHAHQVAATQQKQLTRPKLRTSQQWPSEQVVHQCALGVGDRG